MSALNSTTPSARLTETRAPELMAAMITGPTIAALFVAMRIYTRVFLVRKHFLEDYSIVAALACSILMSVFMGFNVRDGSGKHIEAVSPAQLTQLTKLGIGVIQLYALTHFFLKLSIMLQYLRVTILPWEKRLCHGIIIFLSAGYLAILIVEMVRCVPWEAQYTANYPGAKCINSTAFYFSAQGLNMVLDILILLGPLFILRHSTAPLPQKLLFGVALAFGGIACIISALRLQTLYPSTTTKDPTWDKVPSAFYGVIECNLGITCACVVTLRPLFLLLRRSPPGDTPREMPPNTRDMNPRRNSPHDLSLSTFDDTKHDSKIRDVELSKHDQKDSPLSSRNRTGSSSTQTAVEDEVSLPNNSLP